MATAYAVKITPDNTGLWHINQREDAAEKATELLQKDMESHHVFFNSSGYHNHTSHHILALYGTGASAEDIEKGYKGNESYQRPTVRSHQGLADELRDWERAKSRLGKEQYYTDWLQFFQREIERLGWREALAEYLFKGDERSEDLFARMFFSFVHPLIQLMYGVEWQQPSIVAMAMAQAAVHKEQKELKRFLLTSESAARSAASTPMPSITSLVDAAARDEKLRGAADVADVPAVMDGVFRRAFDEAVKYAAQVKVRPEELDERTAEMFQASIYIAASAAVFPGKWPKFDFYLMHHVNVSPIFITLNSQDWVPIEVKIRLLEWKIRLDLLQFTTRGSAELSIDKIASYVPKDPSCRKTTDLLPRMHKFVDDGHATKLFRALEIGRKACEPYQDKAWAEIKGGLWTQVAHMIVDSVEAPGETWARNGGFAVAWTDLPDRPKPQNGNL
ncbi:HypA protein [Xylariales sp. PMI_506]|nr:HypA protein [Xylariales sp. PMI_506]